MRLKVRKLAACQRRQLALFCDELGLSEGPSPPSRSMFGVLTQRPSHKPPENKGKAKASRYATAQAIWNVEFPKARQRPLLALAR